MADEPKSAGFLSTLPGVLTASAGLIAAITALVAGLHQAGLLGRAPPAKEPPAASPESEPAVSEAKLATPVVPVVQVPTPAAPAASTPPPPAQPAPSPKRKAITAPTKLEPPPKSDPEPAAPDSANYVSRVTLKGDNRTFYVTRQNTIVAVSPSDPKARLVGSRRRAQGDYLYYFEIDGQLYAVDRTSRVWSEPDSPQPVLAGRRQALGGPSE